MKANKDIQKTLGIEHGYFNTFDGKVYYEGDTVPMYHYDSGTAFNGTVIKVIKPGFAGLVKLKKKFTGGADVVAHYRSDMEGEDMIEEWIQQPIPPNPNCYIIAPEPVAWRWSFAMEKIVEAYVMRVSKTGKDDDGDEWRLEA